METKQTWLMQHTSHDALLNEMMGLEQVQTCSIALHSVTAQIALLLFSDSKVL